MVLYAWKYCKWTTKRYTKWSSLIILKMVQLYAWKYCKWLKQRDIQTDRKSAWKYCQWTTKSYTKWSSLYNSQNGSIICMKILQMKQLNVAVHPSDRILLVYTTAICLFRLAFAQRLSFWTQSQPWWMDLTLQLQCLYPGFQRPWKKERRGGIGEEKERRGLWCNEPRISLWCWVCKLAFRKSLKTGLFVLIMHVWSKNIAFLRSSVRNASGNLKSSKDRRLIYTNSGRCRKLS